MLGSGGQGTRVLDPQKLYFLYLPKWVRSNTINVIWTFYFNPCMKWFITSICLENILLDSNFSFQPVWRTRRWPWRRTASTSLEGEPKRSREERSWKSRGGRKRREQQRKECEFSFDESHFYNLIFIYISLLMKLMFTKVILYVIYLMFFKWVDILNIIFYVVNFSYKQPGLNRITQTKYGKPSLLRNGNL